MRLISGILKYFEVFRGFYTRIIYLHQIIELQIISWPSTLRVLQRNNDKKQKNQKLKVITTNVRVKTRVSPKRDSKGVARVAMSLRWSVK